MCFALFQVADPRSAPLPAPSPTPSLAALLTDYAYNTNPRALYNVICEVVPPELLAEVFALHADSVPSSAPDVSLEHSIAMVADKNVGQKDDMQRKIFAAVVDVRDNLLTQLARERQEREQERQRAQRQYEEERRRFDDERQKNVALTKCLMDRYLAKK